MEPNSWKKPNEHYLKVIDNDWYKLLVKLENAITYSTMKFYEKMGIITIHFPVTTSAISSPMGRGSDSTPVKVNIQGIETYLADSMQFLLEYGCRINKNGVFYVMPSFRGEKADERHLCQFYHSEAEIPGTLEDVIKLVNKYIKYLSKNILKLYRDDLINLIGDVSHIEKVAYYKGEFPRITFDEAEIVLRKKFGSDIEKYIEHNDGWRNITKLGEKEILKIYGIVWITNYDELAVPFYQKTDDKLHGTTCNADLMLGIGEVVGCGERHSNARDVLNALKKHEVNPDDYSWYVNMKDKFPMQTAGFGMGIERYLMWILKAQDIRNMQVCLRFNGEENIM